MNDDTGSATTAAFPARAATSATRPAGLAPGADPHEVRHWFDLETIVGLPVPDASFAAALRPSALAALAIAHLSRHADGIALLLQSNRYCLRCST